MTVRDIISGVIASNGFAVEDHRARAFVGRHGAMKPGRL